MNKYKTSDMALSAYLFMKGFTISSIQSDTGSRKLFLFDRKQGLRIEDEARKFANNEPVPVRDYFNSLRDIKNILHSGLIN